MIDLSTASKSDLKDIMAECYNSTAMLAKVLFPERFELPFSPAIHNPIFEIIDDQSIQRAAIAAPRGVGKTSIVNLVVPSRGILFQESEFVVPVSCTAPLAIQQSENLKYELLHNENINQLFGTMKSGEFSKEQWRAHNGWKLPSGRWFPGTGVMPRGARQQIRGLLYLGFRPKTIIVDDLEDPENMDNEDQRYKKRVWFFADLCKAIARYKKDWRIIVLGTMLHQDSVLARLIDDPDWESVSLELCNDKLESNWPEFMTNKDIEREYKEAERQEILEVFYRENRNMTVAPELSGFPVTFKRYSEVEEKINKKPSVFGVVIVDPAKTVKSTSAETGIVGYGVDASNDKIYVRDVVGKRLHPDEICEEAINMADRMGNTIAIGVETTSLEEFIVHPFKDALLKRNSSYQLLELKARGGSGKGEGKKKRVRALSYYYRKGLIYHNDSGVCMPLESQLLSFPNAKKWDIMDAAAYIVEILEKGMIYFPGYDEPAESEEDIEEEYRRMEREYAKLEAAHEPGLVYRGVV